jgi:glycosyltransferase involved in cell wall biosynthesis
MLISLIVCTRNRCASLRTCLEYIERLESPGDWELVIVDNGSTDGTSDLLKNFSKKASFPVVVLQESKSGLGRARNAGIAQARGEILAFTDDDCYVSPDYLIRMLEVFKDEKIGYMGGRVLLFDKTDVPQTIRTETEIRRIEPHSFIRAGQLLGANMAVRKSLIAEIGAFDPEFGAGSRFSSGEDVDLQARASASGATGIYHPGPLVWHHHGRKPGKRYDELMKGYEYGLGAYYAKFILNPQTRLLFLKTWYWEVRGKIRDKDSSSMLREFAGAFRYILTGVFRYILMRLQR